MTTVILGIVGAAFLFGLFTLLRARDRGGCTGGCVGCTGHGSCASDDTTVGEKADITEGVKV
jgi:hypothetical protein